MNKRPEAAKPLDWWLNLPPWERELRTLHYLLDPMPLVVPVSAIVDTSNLPPGLRGEALREKITPCPHQPFRDPAALQIHPYVFRRYVEPQLKPNPQVARPPSVPGGVQEPRTYPPVLFSADHFEKAGAFTFPYREPRDIIRDSLQLIQEHLATLRDPSLPPAAVAYRAEDLEALKEIPLSKALQTELNGLAQGDFRGAAGRWGQWPWPTRQKEGGFWLDPVRPIP